MTGAELVTADRFLDKGGNVVGTVWDMGTVLERVCEGRRHDRVNKRQKTKYLTFHQLREVDALTPPNNNAQQKSSAVANLDKIRLSMLSSALATGNRPPVLALTA